MKKLSINFVKKELKKEGYELLSEKYKNNKTKLRYQCPSGHRHMITWHAWAIGNRCPYCSKKIKKPIEEIGLLFNKEGYTLLTKEYNNAFTYLAYVCPNGHRHKIKWHNWNSGCRCPYCAGQVKPTIQQIKKSFESEGYTLLTKEYKTNRTLLKYCCPYGHEHKISWLKWQQGRRCRECSYIKRGINNSGPKNPNWKGGISSEPYCVDWTKEYKNYIKERDGNLCLNPCCDSKYPKDLIVHHIDYNKKNCYPNNLITICRSCNTKANYARSWHKAWYKTIMYRRYYV